MISSIWNNQGVLTFPMKSELRSTVLLFLHHWIFIKIFQQIRVFFGVVNSGLRIKSVNTSNSSSINTSEYNQRELSIGFLLAFNAYTIHIWICIIICKRASERAKKCSIFNVEKGVKINLIEWLNWAERLMDHGNVYKFPFALICIVPMCMFCYSLSVCVSVRFDSSVMFSCIECCFKY